LSKPAQANFPKQPGQTTHCHPQFLRRNQGTLLARLDFATHSPYIKTRKAVLPVFDVMVVVQ
jgi:hypothetical protein